MKKPKKNSRKLFAILFAFTLSGCARITIRDSEWCGDMGESGAACVHMLSDEEREVTKAAWDQERVGMLCTQAGTFADIKAALLKLCKVTRACTFEEKQLIQDFASKVELLKYRALSER